MHLSRRALAAAVPALLFGSACFAAPPAPAETAPTGPAKLVVYLFDVFHGKHALNQQLVEQTASDPRLRAVAEAALAGFDTGALAAKLEPLLSQVLPAQQFEPCLAFVESEDGAAMMAASRKATSPNEIVAQLQALPPQRQQALERFVGTECYAKTLAVMSSEPGRRIFGEYGKGLVCRYVADTHPELLDKLKQQGECLAP
ncbi:hypothetical protein K4L06_14540 [Lysobacter sp. BMK333-48F3]|uniref:hypothetical protein n=1 Tax=Lysobacter sp. BMK333-48F3 TaxID=2867962 RepID=UPI001C8BC74B|nr:hypothetical protein [Lysobacter sp. BMK333-48F3]MBX9402527.1 hypothetical protein [Lysobacter sp. BMK333-48F3]